MSENRDSWVFVFTVAAAAGVLVSIVAAETFLALACLAWLVVQPRPASWPSYAVPMFAFMATTVVALLMSPRPDLGMGPIRKFVLFTMGLLAANLVNSPWRARTAQRILLLVATAT